MIVCRMLFVFKKKDAPNYARDEMMTETNDRKKSCRWLPLPCRRRRENTRHYGRMPHEILIPVARLQSNLSAQRHLPQCPHRYPAQFPPSQAKQATTPFQNCGHGIIFNISSMNLKHKCLPVKIGLVRYL